MTLVALQMELLRATRAILAATHLGMARPAFVMSVLGVMPSKLGLVDVDVAAGKPEVHETPKAIAVPMASATVPTVLVLHFGRPPEHGEVWREFGHTLAALADSLRLRPAAPSGSGALPFEPVVDEQGDEFVTWLLDRNAALERELDRVRAMVRFLVETAQRQLGD